MVSSIVSTVGVVGTVWYVMTTSVVKVIMFTMATESNRIGSCQWHDYWLISRWMSAA